MPLNSHLPVERASNGVHRVRPSLTRLLGGVMLTACATKRTSTSPSIHRMSRRAVRSVVCAGSPGLPLALVVMLFRELLWIRSGSSAGARGLLREFMGMKSPREGRERNARCIAAESRSVNALVLPSNELEGAA